MDGFRDRLNRGTSERGSYDRYDRSRSRSSYAAPASAGVSADEIAQLLDESNGKQLDVINDLFEDAKDDRFESEKQILTALEDVIAAIESSKNAPAPEPVKEEVVETPITLVQDEEAREQAEKILRTVSANADLLEQFAEEQLPMLVRGNSTILNQIRESLDEKEELLREILNNSSRPQEMPQNNNSGLGDEVLNAATTNNALLNALRSDVAGIQAELRSTTDRLAANAATDESPLDSEDTLTRAQAEEMMKNMEETVHGECVKVYRNVQKVLEDQNGTVAESVKKGVGGLKGLVIVNILLSLFNLVVTVLSLLGII